jgi:uncharacterized sulfatase
MPRQSVLFLIDTQGTFTVGCYAGNPALGTPNIDRLASEGMRFDRAYTCAPVCGPARSAIFTGLYPHTNGVLGNDMAPHADLPTLGQRLQDAGYKTGYIGKWHLDGSDYFGDGRCPPGWDPEYWFDGRNYLESLPDEQAQLLSREMHDPASVAKHGITAEFTHAHRTAEKARAFIEAHREEDFFLVVSIDEPHHPFICPEPFVSAFDDFEMEVPNAKDDLSTKPRVQQEWARHVAGRRTLDIREGKHWLKHPRYFSCNSYSDHEVGRVVEAIDHHTPNALVAYTADHGDTFGHHGLDSKGPALYEEIANIPFILRCPSLIEAGSVSPHPVSHIDLAPTVLDFFGIKPPPLLHGESLLAQCRDPQHATHEHVFVEFNRFEIDHDGFGGFAPIRAVCEGRYKLSINLIDTDEFYDLERDPHELHNAINDPEYVKIRDRLQDAIIAWMGETRDPLRGPHWGRRAWRKIEKSSWGGPTRPRPFDEAYFPRTRLYEDAQEIDRFVYDKI